MKKSEFDPSVQHRFTRPMKWNGKYVGTGDLVPDDGTPVGILRSMFKLRHIEPVTTVTVSNHSAEPVSVKQTEDAVDIQVGAVAEIRNEGSGWYNVYMGGMMISEKKMRKDNAVAWCEEKGLTYNIS